MPDFTNKKFKGSCAIEMHVWSHVGWYSGSLVI